MITDAVYFGGVYEYSIYFAQVGINVCACMCTHYIQKICPKSTQPLWTFCKSLAQS